MNRDFGDLEAFMIETMRKDKIPGLSIAVVDSDQVICSSSRCGSASRGATLFAARTGRSQDYR
jgi:hypothetical protein